MPPPTRILCTEEQIMGYIHGLDTTKTSGPDGISGRMLKGVAWTIVPYLLITRLLPEGCLHVGR